MRLVGLVPANCNSTHKCLEVTRTSQPAIPAVLYIGYRRRLPLPKDSCRTSCTVLAAFMSTIMGSHCFPGAMRAVGDGRGLFWKRASSSGVRASILSTYMRTSLVSSFQCCALGCTCARVAPTPAEVTISLTGRTPRQQWWPALARAPRPRGLEAAAPGMRAFRLHLSCRQRNRLHSRTSFASSPQQ